MAELIRVALPKCDELSDVVDHFTAAGLDLGKVHEPGLHRAKDPWECGFDIECFTIAPKDVGTYVEHGIAHVGVMSTDIVYETEVEVWSPFTFNFGSCPIILAAPRGESLDLLTSRPVLRLATPLPNFTREWFADRGLPTEVVQVSDSAETAVLLGLADGFVARLSDPESLVRQDFRALEVLGHTHLKVVVNTACGARRRAAIRKMIEALELSRPDDQPSIEIPFDSEDP